MVTRIQESSQIGLHDANICFSIEKYDIQISPASATLKERAPTNSSRVFGIFRNCCSPSKPFSSPRKIPLYEILSATSSAGQISLACIRRHRTKRPVKTYIFEVDDGPHCEAFVKAVWAAAYANTQPRKRVIVLLNPFGGSGKAKHIWTEIVTHIFAAAQYSVQLEETQYAGHAATLASKMVLDNFDMVVCVSGDGLGHEVLNGFGRRQDAIEALRMPLAFVPAGSGNAAARSLYNTHEHVESALAIVKGVCTPIDLISITQGNRRYLSYLSTSFGVIADADLGTEHLRWMGQARFTYGVVRRILSRTKYPCTVSLSIVCDDKAIIREEYEQRQMENIAANTASGLERLSKTSDPIPEYSPGKLPPLRYGTVNDPIPASWVTQSFAKMGTFYAGLMPYMSSTACFFPVATPASGLIDILHIQADLPFLSAINTVGAVDSAKHFNSQYCYYARCDAFRLIPERATDLVSVDGERVECEPLQGEVHRALGRIITKNGHYYSEFAKDQA